MGISIFNEDGEDKKFKGFFKEGLFWYGWSFSKDKVYFGHFFYDTNTDVYLRENYGKFWTLDNFYAEGIWKNDKLSGPAKINFPDRSRY